MMVKNSFLYWRKRFIPRDCRYD